MNLQAFGADKAIEDWLEDSRIHPELTRDILVKRAKRGWLGERALTTPVIKGARASDSKVRAKARAEKAEYRYSMFCKAQKVRRSAARGSEVSDLMARYNISKSQAEKIMSKNEWYNVHWDGNSPGYDLDSNGEGEATDADA